MGKFEKGILGHFDGKVGTVVGSTWKGVNYMKSNSKTSKKPRSLQQLIQQARFTVITRFAGALGQLLKDSFNDPSENMTGVNLAVKLNMKHALTGDYPSFGIDYEQALVAQGVQHNVFNPVATASGDGTITTTWMKNGGARAKPNDISVLVAYCPDMQQGVFGESANRSAESGTLDALIFTGKQVHTWILFFTTDKKAVSSSLYTGLLTVL